MSDLFVGDRPEGPIFEPAVIAEADAGLVAVRLVELLGMR